MQRTKFSANTHTPSCCVILLFQFKRFGTDVDKNARDPYGDGDQRRLKGFEGIMVSCLSSALHARHTRVIKRGCRRVVM